MRPLFVIFLFVIGTVAQMPPIEPGVSQELARWRAARYSSVRYKLNLTLEKMSPVLKGSMEIRVNLSTGTQAPSSGSQQRGDIPPIILDWRKIAGHERDSTISNVSLNGAGLSVSPSLTVGLPQLADQVGDKNAQARASARAITGTQTYEQSNDHLIFRDGVVAGENVIKLDFTSPILTSGSAITRYVDKEDGAEYIYSLFVPSDASTAFPVFDQPDLKAKFSVRVMSPDDWKVISNSQTTNIHQTEDYKEVAKSQTSVTLEKTWVRIWSFAETKPISTYVFAFAAGPFERVSSPTVKEGALETDTPTAPSLTVGLRTPDTSIYVRKSQAAKFKPHAAEVFRLNREGIKYLETYFDYKFPFPKYDIVLIPEFPFGGMEHAGATFLRESAIIFPQEPTRGDHISRANLIFHEAAHQWFGDTVTMKWFDDLWLKEGFAEFMAYKTLEKIMPEANAWKVFYERNKQAAYLTDSTRGTTPIYQPIANLSAAKSAYGNIVYRKAPSFLKQAEFYIGPDKFQTAVRAFLKNYEYANAGWEDLVKEFETASKLDLKKWAARWVKQPGMPIYRSSRNQVQPNLIVVTVNAEDSLSKGGLWEQKTFGYYVDNSPHPKQVPPLSFEVAEGHMVPLRFSEVVSHGVLEWTVFFPNYQDYGYGIFLLDEKSRDYVLKNIGREKDDFLRSMMWGALWDSVREGELDPRVYVELAIKQLGGQVAKARASARAIRDHSSLESDETIIQSLVGRVSLALNYYMPSPDIALADAQASATEQLRSQFEAVLIERMRNAPSLGQRITYYRAFLNVASSEKARGVLKGMLATDGNLSGSESASSDAAKRDTLPTGRVSASNAIPLKTKDKFDIVTRLAILGDPHAAKLLADLEKTETSDDAKRYAYAARAGFATGENKAKYWIDFVANKDISESWIEAAFGPWNSIRHSELTLPYLERALKELPNHKRNRKIFFVNGWLAAFIGGHRDEKALAIVNKFLADNPNLDNDLRLKILENVDLIERAVRIRKKFSHE